MKIAGLYDHFQPSNNKSYTHCFRLGDFQGLFQIDTSSRFALFFDFRDFTISGQIRILR